MLKTSVIFFTCYIFLLVRHVYVRQCNVWACQINSVYFDYIFSTPPECDDDLVLDDKINYVLSFVCVWDSFCQKLIYEGIVVVR